MSAIPDENGSVQEGMRPKSWYVWRLASLVAVALAALGCTRAYYHDYADSDVYGILKERLFDWRWRIPERPVEADPRSRMADHNDPNHVPIVPDEVAARRFQVSSRFPFEYRFWRKRGTTPIEDLSWQPFIPTQSDGKVLLGRDLIMLLGITNSRDYQFQFENVYLAALSLTLARFQFMIQGFSNWDVTYLPLSGGGSAFVPPVTTSGTTSTSTSATTGATSTAGTTTTSTSTGATTGTTSTAGTALAGKAGISTPSGASLNNQLLLSAQNGFTLMFMSGAQLLVNLANALVFEFSNHGVQLATPSLTVSLTQPLLRGAWARIVTQPLSLQERNVLYTLRAFAHFRRTFYVGLVANGGYLGLMNQLQGIRNAEYNLKSLKRNLDTYEAEVPTFRSVLERDQVALSYQQSQALLLSLQAGLQTSLDLFKITLGLPTELDVRLDDSSLDPFELSDARLDRLRTEIDELYLKLLQSDALSRPEISDLVRRARSSLDVLEQVHDEVLAEVKRWKEKLAKTRAQGFSGADAAHYKEIFEREDRLSGQIESDMKATDQNIDANQATLEAFAVNLATTPPEEATRQLRNLVGKEVRARLSEVYVAQTQTRVFLIDLKGVDLTVNQAIQLALGNRLDLQNALGAVTDAWRQVEFDANQLRGFLNFNYNGVFNSAPNHDTLFRFDASSSVQTLGLEFEAPINRRAERNQYRADQIAYQRARRAYMQLRDQIVQEIRNDMRQLVLNRRTFEINREQIISSSRQLELAEYDVRTNADPNAPTTLNLLNALNGVLAARNSLIGTWVSYETARMTLHSDFDLMDIDANGVWTNENDPAAINIALRNAQLAPAFSLGIPARVPDLSPGVGSDSTFYIDVEPGGRANRPPDAATDRVEEGPLRPSEFPGAPVPRGGAGGGPGLNRPAAPPAGRSPFAPPDRSAP
jgi:hypothetical protein